MFKLLLAALAILPSLTRAADAQRDVDYGKIPLTFEANGGQTDPRVRYLARGVGYTVFLTPDETVLRLTNRAERSRKDAVLRMRMIGGAKTPLIEPEDPAATRSNYFLGASASAWHSEVAHFGRVRYRSLYPGIDAVYYANQRQLEYDFVVAPGARPDDIRFTIEGARRLRVDSDGNLVISTVAGDLIQQRPRVYQQSAGAKTSIPGEYQIASGKYVSFKLGAYDHTRPLVIDPALSYATFLGGTGYDTVTAMAADSAGNAYIAGTTTSVDFPATAGALDGSCGADGACNGGYEDIFVAKLNPTGTALVYATYIGGRGTDSVSQLLLDGSGNVFLVGQTGSPNFPITPGAFNTVPATNFLLKLNATGSQLAYSTYTVSLSPVYAALAPGGSVVFAATGYAYSALPTTAGAFQTGPRTYAYVDYIAKLNASGTALEYGTYLDGSGSDSIGSVAVDSAGNAVIAGTTTSLDFPVTIGSYQPVFPAGASTVGFVAKLNASGSALVFGTYLPASVSAGATSSMVLNAADDIFLSCTNCARLVKLDAAGSSMALNISLPSGGRLFRSASDDIYLVSSSTPQVKKIVGSSLASVFSTPLMSSTCAIDPTGNLYLALPSYSAPARIATPGALQMRMAGDTDALIAKITLSGGSLRVFPPSLTVIAPTATGYTMNRAAWVFSDGSPNPVEVYFTAASNNSLLTASSSSPVATPESRFDTWNGLLNIGAASIPTPGTYSGSVELTSDGAANSPVSVPVAITVTSAPFTDYYPRSLVFSYTIGGSAPDSQQLFPYYTFGYTTMTATPSGGSWLNVTPQSTTNNNYIYVSVNPTGLAEGSYLATVDLKFPGLPTVQVPVRLIVSLPALSSSPSSLSFSQVQGKPAPGSQATYISGLTGTFRVTTTGESWLTVTPTSGTLAASLTVAVNGASLSPGTYHAAITVSGPNSATVNVPVAFVVIPPNTLDLSPESLSFSYWPGASLDSQSVSLTSNLPVNWTAFATSSGNWLSVTPTGGSTPGTLAVSVHPVDLAAGTYTGTISVVAPDAPNSPRTISVSLNVAGSQPIVSSPASLTFSTMLGVTPAAQTLAISSPSADSFTAVATSAGNWLSVSSATGALPGSISVSVNPAGLALGTYYGTIAISSIKHGNTVGSITVPVTFRIIPKNELRLTPTSIDLTSWSGGPTPSQTIGVSTDSPASLTCTSPSTWLSCYQPSYTSLWIGAYPSNLPPGTYTGTLSVTGESITNGPRTITVNLTVLAAPPVAALPATLAFATSAGVAPAAQMLAITASSAQSFTATASSSGNWLSVSLSSGALPAAISVVVNPGSLSMGSYSGTITISAIQQGNTVGTATVPVTLRIIPKNELRFNPASLNMTYWPGSGTSSQTVALAMDSPASLTCTSPVSWMYCYQSSPGVLSVLLNGSLPAYGRYTTTLTVTGDYITNSPQTLPVTVAVLERPPVAPSPASLTFSVIDGAPAAPQTVTLSAASPAPFTVATQYYANSGNTTWLSVTPTSGTAPASLSVNVNPAGLPRGVYNANIVLTIPGGTISIPVYLQVGATLTASAASVSLTAAAGSSSVQTSAPIAVNSPSGAISFTISASTSGNWLSATQSAGVTPGSFQVTANPAGMAPGTYTGTISLYGDGVLRTLSIPVSFTVASANPAVTLQPSALTFAYEIGGDVPVPQSIAAVAANYVPVNAVVSAGSWLTVTPSAAQTPCGFTVSVRPAGLAAGAYFGVVTITSAGATQTVPVNLNVQQGSQIALSATNLAFAATPGKSNPPAQIVQISSNGRSLPFQAVTDNPWLKLSFPTTQTPTELTVSVDASQLKPGTYSGSISILASPAATRTIAVSLTVSNLPQLTISPAEMNVVYVAGDPAPAPAPLVLFSDSRLSYTLQITSRGWLSVSRKSGVLPDVLQVSIDPAGLAPGTYEGTIDVAAPGAANTPQSVKVTLTVKSPGPVVYAGGVVNAASGLYGPVAPGSRVTIFGENFPEKSEVAQAPWPTSLAKVSVTVNGIAAPIGAVTPNQIEAQMPFEVVPGMARVVVTVDGRSSAAVIVPVISAAPAIFSAPGGASAIQNGDYTANSAAAPARPGSIVVAYLTGQGAVDGRLAAGAAASGSPYLKPVAPLHASVDDTPAEIVFCGMAPGQVGVLQVNIKVPQTPPGEHQVTVTVGGTPSNAVPIFVATAATPGA